MNNKRFRTPDGRIDADKALGFVISKLEQMTPEEFRAVRDAPMPSYAISTKSDRATKKVPTASAKRVESSTVPGKKASPKAVKSAPVRARAKPKKAGL